MEEFSCTCYHPREGWSPIDDAATIATVPLVDVTWTPERGRAQARPAAEFEWRPPADDPRHPQSPTASNAPLPLEAQPAPSRDHIPPGPGDLSIPCTPLPLSQTRTNNRFLFLREIGGPSCLVEFLDTVIKTGLNGPHWGGTLVIDQEVRLAMPLRVPDHFTLAGVGLNGKGRITFLTDLGGAPAITVMQDGVGKVAFRDLAIVGPGTANSRGLKLGHLENLVDAKKTTIVPGRFFLHRTRIEGFGAYGVEGGFHCYGTIIDNCQFTRNGTGIRLIRQCNSWRIRDCIIEDSTNWGIEVAADAADSQGKWDGRLTHTLIAGCRFDRNSPGGILINKGGPPPSEQTFGVMLFGNRFERNAKGLAVRVTGVQCATRIVSNFLGALEVIEFPAGEDPTMQTAAPLGSHVGFNVSVIEGLNVLNAPTPS